MISDVSKKWKISFNYVGFPKTMKHKFPLAFLKIAPFNSITFFLFLRERQSVYTQVRGEGQRGWGSEKET